MKCIKRIGPRTDPCGTPLGTLEICDATFKPLKLNKLISIELITN